MHPKKPGTGLIQKFARYGVTGGIAAIVDLGGFIGLHGMGMSVPLAAALSFLVAAVVNYLLSARFVFSADARLAGFLLFLGVAAIGFAINVSVTSLAQLWLGLAPWVAKLTGIGCAFVINFAMNTGIVFRNR